MPTRRASKVKRLRTTEPLDQGRLGARDVKGHTPTVSLHSKAPERPPAARATAVDALAQIAEASAPLCACSQEAGALELAVRAGAAALRADVGLGRLIDSTGRHLGVRVVSSSSLALAAELEGARIEVAAVPVDGPSSGHHVPAPLLLLAEQLGAQGVLLAPVVVDERIRATVEFLRLADTFSPFDEAVACVLAGNLALALCRLDAEAEARATQLPRERILQLVGDALGAGSTDDDVLAAGEVVELVANATEARGALLWRGGSAERLDLVASTGTIWEQAELAELHDLARHVATTRQTFLPTRVATSAGELAVAAIRLGQEPATVLQLALDLPGTLSDAEGRALARVAARASGALEERGRTRRLSVELEQARAVLAIVAEAIAQLSLAHTLEIAIERVSELLAIDRIAIYLQEPLALEPAAARGIAGPHARIAERLLELALGPLRVRGLVLVEDASTEPGLASLGRELAESRIEAAVGVPLVARGAVVGLLAAYPPRGRAVTPGEAALVRVLAAQLAVAVDNARLHEQAKELSGELEQVLRTERRATRELRALYEISRSFAQSLSLETTLEAVARALVESFSLDAAVIRMPDARGELLVTRAIHVANEALLDPVRAVLSRSQSIAALPVQRLLNTAEPLLLDPGSARDLDTSHSLLAPFLEKGSTAGIIPIATPSEVVGTLTLLSLDPSRPLTPATMDTTRSIAGQAALAIDNARLYQQQKGFADTMQRSLMPRSRPAVPGLELGDVYESSARVDVGGDVYDYLLLPDGRLAVVVGDVTGHGIEATADMAMAKFVFRSLTREHPEPEDFLAAANEVLVGEIPVGKFVTMVCVTIDVERGRLVCASAGHPPPRMVRADGSVQELSVSGIALGVENGQQYAAVCDELGPGSAIVLYTDGLIEARRNGEQYGVERLDVLLHERHTASAQDLASAVVADCRRFAGDELTDDTAVVVIRRVMAGGAEPPAAGPETAGAESLDSPTII